MPVSFTYKQSFSRFLGLGEEAGVDGYIANHPYRDLTFVDGKTAGHQPKRASRANTNPFVNRGTYIRYMMIGMECIEVQEGWVRAGKPAVGNP